MGVLLVSVAGFRLFFLVSLWLAPLLLQSCAMATARTGNRIIVVANRAWSPPPSSEPALYSEWASRSRFQVGDTLVFNYNSREDLVARVGSQEYQSCNASGAIAVYGDGHTAFILDRSGSFYFITGNASHCAAGQKLWIIVLAQRNLHAPPPSPSPASAPAPSPPSLSPSSFPSPSASPPPPPPSPSSPSPPPGSSSSSSSASVTAPSPAMSVFAVFVAPVLALTAAIAM